MVHLNACHAFCKGINRIEIKIDDQTTSHVDYCVAT